MFKSELDWDLFLLHDLCLRGHCLEKCQTVHFNELRTSLEANLKFLLRSLGYM